MKLKTSISILAGCLIIFLFIMLPIFLSIEGKKNQNFSAFKGSNFSLKDMNNNTITEESFDGPLTAIFFGFTNCPDICPMTLNKMDIVVNHSSEIFVFGFTVFILACIIGYYVVWSVTPSLHSPLMSVTNAISSVIIVGAILAAGPNDLSIAKFFGLVAVVLASVNIFGGFIVTYRMLSMFKKKPKKQKTES